MEITNRGRHSRQGKEPMTEYEPYIYINGGKTVLIQMHDDDDEIIVLDLATVTTGEADYLLSCGLRVVIEGLNDEETLAADAA
jgi:hypothetical protein